jgi:hypothetical protein
MVMATFNIQPIGDEVHTTVIVNGKAWRKRYESIPDATAEGVELGMMDAHARPFVEEVLGQRTLPTSDKPTRQVDTVLIESTRPLEVDLDELATRGFLPGS